MKQVRIDRYGPPEEVEDIKAALAHAQQGERSGKILVAPNG
jgi:hypothetical protein